MRREKVLKGLVLVAVLAVAGCERGAPAVRPTGGATVTVTPQGVKTGVSAGVELGILRVGVAL